MCNQFDYNLPFSFRLISFWSLPNGEYLAWLFGITFLTFHMPQAYSKKSSHGSTDIFIASNIATAIKDRRWGLRLYAFIFVYRPTACVYASISACYSRKQIHAYLSRKCNLNKVITVFANINSVRNSCGLDIIGQDNFFLNDCTKTS